MVKTKPCKKPNDRDTAITNPLFHLIFTLEVLAFHYTYTASIIFFCNVTHTHNDCSALHTMIEYTTPLSILLVTVSILKLSPAVWDISLRLSTQLIICSIPPPRHVLFSPTFVCRLGAYLPHVRLCH